MSGQELLGLAPAHIVPKRSDLVIENKGNIVLLDGAFLAGTTYTTEGSENDYVKLTSIGNLESINLGLGENTLDFSQLDDSEAITISILEPERPPALIC
ncbi:hypothetical protein [Spartinivicinus poritis]|uniref:Uncharacterized protein n=1 Tax=Spartinivicinus poritis TaxID=2994640 RepID=A0ABT5UH96_9GAMM|nr:hypothetical protein [Spartinivicinus sp. A2-2]MDE1465740.1 hypothetical protein [Spartinivicinus sp. A2-2]